MNKDELKKELKKLCKNFRKQTKDEYPKAIMTERQKELNTASINCGGGFGDNKFNLQIREGILISKEFKDFVEKYNLIISKETTSFKDYIIRIRY